MSSATMAAPAKLEKKPIKFSNLLRESPVVSGVLGVFFADVVN